MNRPLYTVGQHSQFCELRKKLAKGVFVLFMFTAVPEVSVAIDDYRASWSSNSLDTIVYSAEETACTEDVSPIQILARSTSNLSAITIAAFNDLVDREPEASEMYPVLEFIMSGLEKVNVERASVDYNMSTHVLNVAYRMPGNILLSISKPQETIEDSLVIFNLYHKRELLVSDIVDIEILSQYLHKVESRIG